MKHYFKYFACLLVAVLCFGQVWAGEVTISPSQALNDHGVSPITIQCAKGDGSSNPAISSGQLRLYQAASGKTTGNTITFICSDYNITSIVFTFANNMTASNGSFSEGSYDAENSTWTGSTKALTLTVTGTTSGKRIYITNMVVTYDDGGDSQTCATPTFSPAAGSYEGTQNVTISSTAGATIYYTTDDSDPTTSGTRQTYSSPIAVSADMTIKAYAVKAEYDDSEVAEAAYTITEGPDVTLNLIDGNWSFPTSGGTSLTEYTNSETGYKVSCYAANEYKVNSSNYFIIGKSGSYILLPEFANPIEKIVVVGNSAGSGSVIFNIFDGDDAASTAVTGCTTDKTFEITNPAANKQYSIKVTSGHNLQLKAIKIYYGAAPAVAQPTISGADNFLTSTEVTMECSTEGAAIYYTITESAKATPATSGDWAAYNGASKPSFSATTTVWAAAKLGDDWSAVAEQTFTKATVMTVAEAIAALEESSPLANKYVAGTISYIDAFSSPYITYYISDDGTRTGELEVYKGKGLNNTDFSAVTDLNVGDDVTVFGNLKIYNTQKEFDKDNYIIARKPVARLSWSAESYDAALEGANTFPTLTNTDGVTVSYSSSDPAKASFADASVYAITLNAVGSTTITATFAGNETYKANSASYTLNIASALVTLTYNVDGGEAIDPVNVSALPNPLPTTTKAGKNFGGWFTDPEKTVDAVAGAAITENTTLYAKWLDPYTVAEAKTVVGNNTTGIANQYVAGIISQIDSYNGTYHSITYWISADGTTTDQLEVYSGLIGNAATALDKEQFSAKTDLEVGDEVVVTGTLKKFNVIYEFDKNNTIYSFSRKASAGLVYATTAVNKVVGDAAFVNELTNPNSVDVTYETSDDQVAEVANDGTVTIIGEGTATISASFAGNATYKAAVVSYTLTVSATTDTRKEANGPAKFTATSGDLDPDDIAYASYQGGSSTAPAIYNDGIRLYQIGGSNDFGGFITLTAKAGCTIDEVQITTTSKYATTVAYSVDGNENLFKSESVAASSSYTTGTGLNVSSVNILNVGTGSSGRLEIASIKVYYTGEAATIDHYELGGTYQTAFMQDEEFNHTGLIVYAAYDALGENKVDITSMCTFSEPDMSTTGEKTIEITYNEAVVISYTINVAADSRKVAESPVTFTTVSGDMTPNDITFASYQGEAGTAPANYNDGIRLYQAPSADKIGGYITLKAKKGCTIDQVKITTTNSYATTVAYSVDGNENLLGSESVAKSSDYSTPSGLNVESVNIVNKGTGSSGRLEIASIKVWYTGDALAVDHYILGGTYATEFEQYGEFNYEGLTVTAAYDAGETITEAVTGFTVEADLSTAGAAKANVMLNSVKIAEYDITVTASAKEDPALAYSPTSVVLTLGQSLSAPTFSNTYNVSPITYSSDKPAVATVDAEGNIALVGATGVAVITAHFEGDDDYIESTATFTITVNEPTEDLSGTWVLATSVAAGDKIIIGATYQDETKSMGAQNGNNRLAVASTLDAGVLSPGEGTKVFTLVDAGDGKFAIQALNGNYLSAAGTGTSNYLKETADYTADNAKWSISIDGEGVASVVALSENRNAMQYNSGSTLFSCYASVTSQRPINIYKKGSYERDGLTIGNYGTICLPNGGTIANAKLFDLEYYDGANTLYLLEVNGNAMEAGHPYVFLPSATSIEVTYTDNASANAGSFNGLVGSFSQETITADDGNYILYNNMYYLVNSTAYVGENRAYIHMPDVPDAPTSTPQGDAPRRRVAMNVNGRQVATGISDIETNEQPVKVMIDGNLYIIRAGQMYDMTGSKVK